MGDEQAVERLTHSLELMVVVQGLWGVGLNGSHVQAAAKSNHDKQANDLGELLRHRAEADAVKLGVVDVEQLIDLPEVPRRLQIKVLC